MKKNKPKKIKCVIIGAGYMSEEYVKTIKSDKSIESSEILEIADGLTYFLEMKFINAWQSFK